VIEMSEKVKIYHVETQEDYDDLMIKLEDQGYLWISGDKPTAKNCWLECQEETVICLNEVIDREMRFSSLGYTKREYPEIPIIKHKAKGVEQMEKVVVPQFVADYIENHYDGTIPTTLDKADLIRDWDNYINVSGNLKVKEWVKNESNFLSFVMAIATNNYEVEEKKYYWKRKSEHSLKIEESGMVYLNYYATRNAVFFGSITDGIACKTKFTETEVKQLVGEEDFNKLEKVEITE